MTESEVHSKVVKWVADVSCNTCIKAYEGGDRPEKPYSMVNLLNISEIRQHTTDVCYEETGVTNSQGNAQIQATPIIETEWEFSVHSYGEDHTKALRDLRSRLQIDGPQQGFDRYLSVFDMGTINNVPEKIKNAWEQRAHARLFIRGYTRDGFLIDVIDQAPTTLTTNY